MWKVRGPIYTRHNGVYGRRPTGAWWPLLLMLWCMPMMATTWFVRTDGGTRFSANVPKGQCDGTGDAAYSGHGANQHCAFNDIRLLWQDGSYAYSPPDSSFPAAGWIGQGGDTYIVRGSIAAGTEPYRVGWNSNEGNGCDPAFQKKLGTDACYRGWRGNPYAGPPTPPAGTAARHTRILGENWQNCHVQTQRTQVVAGFSVGSAFNFFSSYIDFQCFDISDKSDCTNNDNCKGQDFSVEGIGMSNTADHLTLTDIRIHGMKTFGMLGPSGDGSVFNYISLVGNGGGGWNADAGDGKTGTGTLLVQHYEIKWNGCGEEYPIKDPLPYKDCTDDNSGGYGDGFGTATVASKPGWQAHFDQGEVAYNTQDGLDALHLIGTGSSMTVTRTLAYGNMGQQIKVGGAAGRAVNNLIVGNCTALSFAIPGTPPGFNAKLSDYCRAGDQAVVLTVGRGSLTRFENNTLYEAGNIGIDIECDTSVGTCDGTARLSMQNNIIIGFPNNAANGNKEGDGRLPTAIYNNTEAHPFTNRGSVVRNNTVLHHRTSDPCPMGRFDRNAECTSPMLRDETYHPYSYGDMRPVAGGRSVGTGAPIPGVQVDLDGATRPALLSRGALEPGSSAPKGGPGEGTQGDTASGGGGDLVNLVQNDGEEVFSPSDEVAPTASSGAPRLLRHLLRPATLCAVVVVSGAGLFLLGRASRGTGSKETGDRGNV